MLPTKGYFQDIECPYFNSSCGRPYCHFRHKKKQSEYIEEVLNESEKESSVVPIYKPTPKSELANIHNSKSHIPISYVPDLTFRPDRKSRPTPKFEKPTYKPTPLSILSSANKRERTISEENGEHIEAIKEIKQNIANVEYDPTISLQTGTDIDFEDLSTEFDLIDEIINSSDKVSKNTEETEKYDPSQVSIDISNSKLNETSKNKKEINVTDKNFIKDDYAGMEDKSVPETSSHNDCRPSGLVSETGFADVKNKSQDKFSKYDKTSCNDSKHKNKPIDRVKKVLKEEHERSDEKHEKSDKRHDNKEGKCDKKEEKHEKKEVKHEKKEVKLKEKEGKHERKEAKHEKKEVKHEKKEEKHEKKESSKRSDKVNKEKQNKSSNLTEKKSKCDSIHLTEEKSKEREKYDKHEKRKHQHEKSPKRFLEMDVNTKKKHSHKSDKSHNSSSKEKHKSKEDQMKRDRRKDSIKSHDKSSKSQDKHKSDKNPSKSVEKSKISQIESSSRDKVKGGEEKAKKSKMIYHQPEKHDKSESKDQLTHNSSKDLYETSNESEDDEPVSFNRSGSLSPDSELDNDETMLECYKIFNEYKPPRNTKYERVDADISIPVHDDNVVKKRIAHANIQQVQVYQKMLPVTKPKAITTPGQTLANRYKIAQAAQASKEQELLMNEIQLARPLKRSAPSLLEAAREHKIRRETPKQSPAESACLIDDILKGTSKTCSQVKIVTRIAPAQNVMLMAKAKERISKIKQTVTVKTVAQTQKGNRTAHVPEVSLSDIPDVLQADKSKLPVNVRTRFLTMIADECVKLYISKEEAYSRALNEEYSCYEKCKVLTTYRNSAMLAVNRLRKEIQERNKSGLGLIGLGETLDNNSSSGSRAQAFYNEVKRWLLTEEELDLHGYPRFSEEHHGRAVIKNLKNLPAPNLDENQRICVRCHKLYHVDDDGWPLYEEECCYHPLRKRTIRGEQTYLCCRSNDASGCVTSDTHVSESTNPAELEGYQTTLDPEYEDDTRSYAVYALDCEMCYTTKGLELTRVTIVDTDCKTVYESLVKPLNPIIDYNTRFSGITKDQMEKTSTSILQIQANILHLCNSKTILVGHSLESDMKALKIVHSSVIDTSVLFPHKMGLPHKRALKVLASEYLRKIIQNDVSGHDSAEDAVTCMELLKWKLNDERKGRHNINVFKQHR